jgi:hypothetical protein
MQGMRQMIVGETKQTVADACIEACTWCELACLACAETCLGEMSSDELALCVQLSLDCAEVCWTTRKFVADAIVVAPRLVQEQLEACALMCAATAAECSRQRGLGSELKTCQHSCARCQRLCLSMQTAVANLH